ncbi:MAG: stage II sporulation protein M [Methanoregulaceae archaeon]|nr:stage II sporulation protein M [Methanoregulaceae archaeon]
MYEGRTAPAYLTAIILFSAGIAVGIVALLANPDLGKTLMETLRNSIMGDIAGETPPVVFVKILANNLQACLLLFLGGASLGVLTAFIISSNGVIIGAVIEIVREREGILYVAAGVVPHGVFEIPSFIISGGLGFLLAGALWREWNGAGDAAAEASGLGRTFLRFVVPLVTIAAFIEAFITPEIIRLVL